MKENKNNESLMEILSKPKVKRGNYQEATVVSFKVVGGDKESLVFKLKFDNGAEDTAYFCGNGIDMALNRLQMQSEDYDDYGSVLEFLQSRVGKRLLVDVSRYKQRMNYMFSKPNVIVSDSDKEI
jgi:hypothetical protein